MTFSTLRLGFNRTFMELKVYMTNGYQKLENSFNRTFMELKAGSALGIGRGLLVSIAPLWN